MINEKQFADKLDNENKSNLWFGHSFLWNLFVGCYIFKGVMLFSILTNENLSVSN